LQAALQVLHLVIPQPDRQPHQRHRPHDPTGGRAQRCGAVLLERRAASPWAVTYCSRPLTEFRPPDAVLQYQCIRGE